MNYDLVIVASGKGQRADLGYNKVFYKMKDGRSVLEHSLSLFLDDEDCKNVIVVTNEEYFNEIIDNPKIKKTSGGKERKDSVRNGLDLVTSEYVMIHDGARPFLKKETLEEIKDRLSSCDALCLGHMASDTIKVIEGNKIVKTLDRNSIFMAETPQTFKSDLIKESYKRCEDVLFTDDASLVESLGYKVEILINKFENKKLTMKEDFEKL